MKRLFALAMAAAAGLAAQQAPRRNPALVPVTDTPGLPRVLLIGDSISIGYTVPVRQLLAGKANVHRILENGGPTIRGIEKIDRWLAPGQWDVIHFNFGLHDLRLMEDGKHQVALAPYAANLREIAKKLKAAGARVIWANTTPVPEGKLNPPRSNADVIAYNQAAAKIMREFDIPTDDLYGLVLPRESELQLPANVHFTPAGYDALAKQVAEEIAKALFKR